jgi:GNAT superfamily N-acetyltransferase
MPDSSQHIFLREATITDAAALAHYRLMLFSEIEHEPTPDEAMAFGALCQRTFEDLFQSDSCVAWLAEVPGQQAPVGTLVMLKNPRLPTLGDARAVEGYIINVYVVPAWRRVGIASALMQAAVDYARKTGLARIRLRATEAGQAVYQRVGFKCKESVMELKLA